MDPEFSVLIDGSIFGSVFMNLVWPNLFLDSTQFLRFFNFPTNQLRKLRKVENFYFSFIFDPRMGLFDRCFKGKKNVDGEESANESNPPAAPSSESAKNPRQTMIERSASGK